MYLVHEHISDEAVVVGLGETLEDAARALVSTLRKNGFVKQADKIENGLEEIYVTSLKDGGGVVGSDDDERFAFPDAGRAPPM